MRTFTEKDKLGLARALQTFLGYMNAQKVQIKMHLAQVERALAEGLTVDELLNPANYARVQVVMENASLEEYVTALIERKVVVKCLKDDEGWDDSCGFDIIANYFHDFYMEIIARGGVYSTANAKINLLRAIKRNSLQALFSEELILDIANKSNLGDKLTCYQYISFIIEKQEDFRIDNSLSEAQNARRELEESLMRQQAEANNEDNDEDDEDFDGIYPENEAERNIDVNESENIVIEPVTVDTDGIPEENDESIYGLEDLQENENMFNSQAEEVFIAAINPKLYKKNTIRDAFFGLTIDEFKELARPSDPDTTIDEFISQLSNGKFKNCEDSATARNAHQFLNGELYPRFLECIKLQGVVLDEDTVMKMDLLNEDWDMRDEKTRKIQKLKELIYKDDGAVDDPDIMSIINDLEQYYDVTE